MLQTKKKLQCLVSLTACLVCFGIALTMIILEVHVSARVAGLVAAFFSGWGCCYSLGVMSGGIAEEHSSYAAIGHVTGLGV